MILPGSRALMFSYDEVVSLFGLGATPLIFLGLAGEEPWFALGLPGREPPPDMGVPGKFAVLNEVVTMLPASEAAVLAYA